jgi:hypothetical protein
MLIGVYLTVVEKQAVEKLLTSLARSTLSTPDAVSQADWLPNVRRSIQRCSLK